MRRGEILRNKVISGEEVSVRLGIFVIQVKCRKSGWTAKDTRLV
jgi:hypothetical protein